MSGFDSIGERLSSVHARIAAAAVAAGRDPSGVRLVAVTKRLGAQAVRAAYALGERDFGENYVQEAAAKIAELSAQLPEARWHMIGRLQSNKASLGVRLFTLLHGIDSQTTVAALSRAALREGRVIDLLLQVRLGRRRASAETDSSTPAVSRGGVEEEDAAEFLRAATSHAGVRFVGLMGVADPDLDPRMQFAGLRRLATDLTALGLKGAPLGELSMGMTDDLEAAIAEGATIVRIGTAIFGERQPG